MSRNISSKIISGLILLSLLALVLTPVACAKAPAPSPTPSPTTAAPKPSPSAAASPTAPAPSPKAPAPTSAVSKAGWPATLAIGCQAPGSALYTAAVAVAKVITAYTGVKAEPSVHTTMAVFPKEFKEQVLDLGVLNTIDSYNSMRGLDMWKGAPITDTRYLVSLIKQGVLTFATKDSGIKTMADIKGKRYLADYVGSATTKLLTSALFDVYGLTDKNTTILPYTSTADIASGIKEGRADAGFYYIAKSTPFLTEIALSKDLNYISVEEDKMKQIMAKIPVVPGSIPAGSYKGQDKEWSGIGMLQAMAIRSTLPDDLVYSITAAIYDHWDEYVGYAAVLADLKLPAGLSPDFLRIPVHAGAVKYYKEKGWWTKALDDKQNALLKELNLQK